MDNNINFIKAKNNEKIDLNDIPSLDIDDLRCEIISMCNVKKLRPIAFFGKDWGRGQVKLYVVLGDDNKDGLGGKFYITSSLFKAGIKSYECLTNDVSSFYNFEREFFEEFKIKPLNHPWLKPLRTMGSKGNDYPFFKMEGDNIHEVAVGPIHAGIIEPGHFRFMCNGENVYHLEIALGYQRKQTEKMMAENPSNQLIESVSGDSVIAYSLAYSNLMESMKEISVSNKAQLIRMMALEMERVAIHIGDLGAIAGDIAYLMGASVFGATRTLVINTMLEFSGSRFGRGLITLGGVNFDIDEIKIEKALKMLKKVEADVTRMVKTMLKNSSVMSRLEKTGTVSKEKAQEAGLVGMAARASGVNLDIRFDYPTKWMEEFGFLKQNHKETGDVNSRFQLRYKEIIQSISMIREIFERLKKYKNEPINSGYEVLYKENSKNAFIISATEGWRGEVIHIGMSDDKGNLTRYKIKDPSFNNWYGLALAVRNNGVSDFPLCNKSFNLSYSGFDL